MNIIGNNIVEISAEEKVAIANAFNIIITSIKQDIQNS